MKNLTYLTVAAFLLIGCATTHKTYQPPSNVKLEASTGRLSKAVDSSHVSARQAQASVAKEEAMLKEIQKIKDLPPIVLNAINDLAMQVAQTKGFQTALDAHLTEADNAKAEVELDKSSYYAGAQNLAQSATQEREARIKAEKSLSWYRWHSLMLKVVSGIVIVIIVLLVFLWFTGKLAVLGSSIASKIP